MASPMYTAEATSQGNGRNGEVTTSDGVLDETLATPKEMGGAGGDHTNPEQLFAAGYAACFHSALQLVAKQSDVDVGDSQVTAKVGLGKNEQDKLALSVTLSATLSDMEQGKADELVAQAHQVCPYSNATRGNIEVEVVANTRG